MNATSKKHEFIGEYGWLLRWSESDSGFKLENSKMKNVIGNIIPTYLLSHLNNLAYVFFSEIGIYNDTQEYPMGWRKWIIINDNCPDLDKQYLLFSSCSLGEFTCDDGSCIDQKYRCDIVKHCRDNSDEKNCDKVQIVAGTY